MLKLQLPGRIGFAQGKVLPSTPQRPRTDPDSNRRWVPIVTLFCMLGTAEAAIALDSFPSSLPQAPPAQTSQEKPIKEKPLPAAGGRLPYLDKSAAGADPDTAAAAVLVPDAPAGVATHAIVDGAMTVSSGTSVVQPSQTAVSLTVPTTTLSSEIALPSNEAAASEVTPSPEVMAEAAAATAEIPWRFVLEPYVYLPFETSGDVTINNIEVPFDYDLGEVLESLTFATYGRFEAWKGPWAFVFDGYYFNTIESDSTQVNTPPSLQGLLPGQVTIDSTAETSFTKLDLAGAYRFGDGNLANAFTTADTEFDLGPFLFDAIAGVRLYFFSNDIHLTSDIGREFDLSRSSTFVEPLLGGRARWNLSDHLAVLAAANVSGFGISGLTFSLESYAGIDWMFSGNTSLTAAYRITYIDYDRDNSGVNLFQHGPALGVKFRF